MAERPRRPEWMKVRAPSRDGRYFEVEQLVRGAGLHTICEEARCPNIAECWGRGTATFQILGETCTRACRYCYVHSGTPDAVDPLEPLKLAQTAATMGLAARRRHVRRPRRPARPRRRALRGHDPRAARQAPAGDRRGAHAGLPRRRGGRRSRPCSRRGPTSSTTTSRPSAACTAACAARKASYDGALSLLRRAKEVAGYDVMTKSGIIVGLGETNDEVVETMRDLRGNGVDVVTIGQYLQPSAKHATIDRWVHPDEFRWFREQGEALGFGSVFSGPLVRSSYRADEQRHAAATGRGALCVLTAARPTDAGDEALRVRRVDAVAERRALALLALQERDHRRRSPRRRACPRAPGRPSRRSTRRPCRCRGPTSRPGRPSRGGRRTSRSSRR